MMGSGVRVPASALGLRLVGLVLSSVCLLFVRGFHGIQRYVRRKDARASERVVCQPRSRASRHCSAFFVQRKWTFGSPGENDQSDPDAISFSNFETVERDGLAIHIESEIKPPTRWVITHTRLPWPHFNALYDPVEHGDRVGTVIDNILWP
jgi:hypothetical protein